ncbi:hypothetical protein [Streptomyces sp. NPDC047981]|uniref:hypothetical protein n=1 Tax=Streptomyces sp. NPDC047981 TaxID=3154610 RepID=UPI00344739B3
MTLAPDDSRKTSARLRLDHALERVEITFRGMTAQADEVQCDCHWGSDEELALLKRPDIALDPDLLRRTWSAPDWRDHGAVLRRVLPQLARSLVQGMDAPAYDMEAIGRSFARGGWREWPEPQSAAVWEFLHAWWAYSLTTPEPAVAVHDLIILCVEASETLTPWLAAWEALDDRHADRHLAEAADAWEYDLLADSLPWYPWSDESAALCAELSSWLARHAPTRLRTPDVSEELLHRIRLIGLTGPARWEDPHWPNHRY